MSSAAMLGTSTRSVLVTATPFVRRHLLPQRTPPRVLGRFPSALYLELEEGTVVAVLTSDALALPIGLILPTTSAQTPLDDHGDVDVTLGGVRLGGLRIVAARERSARLEHAGTPRRERIAESVRRLAPAFERTALALSAIHDLTHARQRDETRSAVRALLGRGPGLTPAGDDVMTGVLAGAVCFGRDAGELRRAVLAELAQRPRATTSLSRQLLERVCDGDAIPELGSLARGLCDEQSATLERALARLLTIGHSSGVALAYGLTASCELA